MSRGAERHACDAEPSGLAARRRSRAPARAPSARARLSEAIEPGELRSSHGHQGGQLSDFDASSERWIAAPETALLGRAAKAPAVAAGARGDGRLVPRWGERLERATRGRRVVRSNGKGQGRQGRGFPGHAFAGTLHLEQYSDTITAVSRDDVEPLREELDIRGMVTQAGLAACPRQLCYPLLPQEGHFNFTEKRSRVLIPTT